MAIRDEKGHRQVGIIMESLACDLLRQQGFVILERNLYLSKAEMDIIALDGRTLVFIEVKARSHRITMEELAEIVTPAKEQRMIHIADSFVQRCNEPYDTIRFDFIFISDIEREPEMQHYPNAFIPSYY